MSVNDIFKSLGLDPKKKVEIRTTDSIAESRKKKIEDEQYRKTIKQEKKQGIKKGAKKLFAGVQIDFYTEEVRNIFNDITSKTKYEKKGSEFYDEALDELVKEDMDINKIKLLLRKSIVNGYGEAIITYFQIILKLNPTCLTEFYGSPPSGILYNYIKDFTYIVEFFLNADEIEYRINELIAPASNTHESDSESDN